MLLSQRRYLEALEQFNAAYSEGPDDAILNKNLGLLWLKWGDDDQAARFFKRALFFGPTQWDASTLLGEAYLRLGHPLDAVHALQSTLKLYEQSTVQNKVVLVSIYAQLGEAYIRLGHFPDAARALQSALTFYGESTTQQVTHDSLRIIITWVQETLHYLEQGLTTRLLPHPLLRKASSPTN